MRAALKYPAVARSAASYVLHGTTIPEPFQTLELPDDPVTAAFVKDQNELFRAQYPEDSTIRANLKAAISKTFFPRASAPYPRGGKYFFYYNSGIENQSRYMASETLDATTNGEVWLDPNTFSADGTTALGTTAWSESDKYFAYALADKGSDWNRILVRDAAGTDLPDKVEWVKFSGIQWLRDDGFFYVRYPHLAEGQEKGTETDAAINGAVYYHALGTDQSKDVRIADIPEHPTQLPQPVVTDDNKYLLISISEGCEPYNKVWVAELPADFATNPQRLTFDKLVDNWEGRYDLIGNDGSLFYFSTTFEAPNSRLIALDVSTKERTELVKEKASVLNNVALVGDKLILIYLEDVKDVMYVRDLKAPVDSPLSRVELPIGTVTQLSCKRFNPFVSLKVSSFVLPGRSYLFDPTTLALTKFRDDLVEGLVPDDYSTSQVFVPVEDGTKIPMFIIHRKDLDLTAPNPTMLYGYGGFNISITPSFSPSRIVFMNNLRGIYCIANIRGGGEYGEKWHDGGRKTTKMNCFTDFIGCAKYLNSQPFCSPKHLAIQGGSNGGLLTAACANLAPEQFAAVVTQVGVLDMYKFHKFTIGHAWRSDYGDPDVEADFKVLQTYSPLHNVVPGKVYPPILVVTGDHDDRVAPLHSLKYVAELQHANPSLGGPFLARVEVAAGHGAGKPTSKVIDESADIYAYLADKLGATWHE